MGSISYRWQKARYALFLKFLAYLRQKEQLFTENNCKIIVE